MNKTTRVITAAIVAALVFSTILTGCTKTAIKTSSSSSSVSAVSESSSVSSVQASSASVSSLASSLLSSKAESKSSSKQASKISTASKPNTNYETGVYKNPPVYNDNILETALRDALKKPSGELTKQDCSEIASIEITYSSPENKTKFNFRKADMTKVGGYINYTGTIGNFKMLELLSEIKEFTFNFETFQNANKNSLDFDIKVLEPLKKLNKVIFETYTDSHNFKLYNGDCFNRLTGLKILFLAGCKGIDYSSIGKLTGLTELTLAYTGISDVKPLAGLVNLEMLNLGNSYLGRKVNSRINKVKDISTLKNMKKLKRLYITANEVSNISVVKELPSLTEFDCRSNKITDFSPLNGLNINVAKDNNPAADLK